MEVDQEPPEVTWLQRKPLIQHQGAFPEDREFPAHSTDQKEHRRLFLPHLFLQNYSPLQRPFRSTLGAAVAVEMPWDLCKCCWNIPWVIPKWNQGGALPHTHLPAGVCSLGPNPWGDSPSLQIPRLERLDTEEFYTQWNFTNTHTTQHL